MWKCFLSIFHRSDFQKLTGDTETAKVLADYLDDIKGIRNDPNSNYRGSYQEVKEGSSKSSQVNEETKKKSQNLIGKQKFVKTWTFRFISGKGAYSLKIF